MATSGSWSNTSWKSGYWSSTSNTKYYHWSGNWSKSGNTISLSSQKLWMTFAQKSSANNVTDKVKTGISGSMSSWHTVTWKFTSVKTSPKVSLNNKSFTVGATATSATIRCEIDGEKTGTLTIYFDATNYKPTAPTVSVSPSSATSIDATWGTTNIGNPAGTCTLYYGTTSTPSTVVDTVSASGTNNTTVSSLTANTQYYFSATATNSVGSDSSSVVSAVTYPAGITSITTTATTTTSATFSIVFDNSGSALTTTAQVSTDGTNWTDTSLTNVQGTTATYTVTGLAVGTSYTRYFRVTTTAGSSAATSVSFRTKSACVLYASVGGVAKPIKKLYASVNGVAKPIKKLYASVGGVAKLIFEGD